MADNGIQEIDVRSGAVRQVVKGTLAIPLGIAAVTEAARDTLDVADVFALRSVDAAQGRSSTSRAPMQPGHPSAYPVAITANQRHLIVTNNEGPVQRYERKPLRLVRSWPDTHAGNAIEMPFGRADCRARPRAAS